MKKHGTILVIEQERIVSMEIKMELELRGYSVVQANSLESLRDHKTKINYKAIILDIDDLNDNDFEFMKQHFDLNKTMVIAISSDLPESEGYRGIKFVQTFLKPINCKSIATLIASDFTALKYH